MADPVKTIRTTLLALSQGSKPPVMEDDGIRLSARIAGNAVAEFEIENDLIRASCGYTASWSDDPGEYMFRLEKTAPKDDVEEIIILCETITDTERRFREAVQESYQIRKDQEGMDLGHPAKSHPSAGSDPWRETPIRIGFHPGEWGWSELFSMMRAALQANGFDLDHLYVKDKDGKYSNRFQSHAGMIGSQSDLIDIESTGSQKKAKAVSISRRATYERNGLIMDVTVKDILNVPTMFFNPRSWLTAMIGRIAVSRMKPFEPLFKEEI